MWTLKSLILHHYFVAQDCEQTLSQSELLANSASGVQLLSWQLKFWEKCEGLWPCYELCLCVWVCTTWWCSKPSQPPGAQCSNHFCPFSWLMTQQVIVFFQQCPDLSAFKYPDTLFLSYCCITTKPHMDLIFNSLWAALRLYSHHELLAPWTRNLDKRLQNSTILIFWSFSYNFHKCCVGWDVAFPVCGWILKNRETEKCTLLIYTQMMKTGVFFEKYWWSGMWSSAAFNIFLYSVLDVSCRK